MVGIYTYSIYINTFYLRLAIPRVTHILLLLLYKYVVCSGLYVAIF